MFPIPYGGTCSVQWKSAGEHQEKVKGPKGSDPLTSKAFGVTTLKGKILTTPDPISFLFLLALTLFY